MELLTISDKASSIGDNRMSGDVDTETFKTAAQLGIPFGPHQRSAISTKLSLAFAI